MPTKVTKEAFIFMYEDQKRSGAAIARFFGISRTSVDRYIKRYGLKRRTIAEVRHNNFWSTKR